MDDPSSYTVYHQCTGWALRKGSWRSCQQCRRGTRGRPTTPKPKPRARYTYDEAVDQIDYCAGCGNPIPEDHPEHYCDECLPMRRQRLKSHYPDYSWAWEMEDHDGY